MNTKTFEDNMNMLNKEQLEAVESLDGPVMVIAGPGTGKTQIIGMRTANIILKAGVEAQNILITTFTEAGVIAIRERLISLIGSEAHKVHVATIHSFSQDIIKSFPEKFTQEKLDTPIDDIESLEIISTIVSDFLRKESLEYLTSYGDTLFYVRDIKSSIGKLKQEGVTPENFLKIIEQETQKSLAWLEEKRNNKRIKKIENYEKQHEERIGKLTELQKIFKAYNTHLRKNHLYDFNDMINFVLERFRGDEDLRAHFAETYQYIMLDEYQDTNNPQNEIIDMILSYGDTKNIMVVGDDDQSIYRFQGANIENMLDFTTKYSDAKIIVLEKNYRSLQPILDSAKTLIEHNSQRLISRIPKLEKNIISQIDTDNTSTSINLYHALSDIDERLSIKDEILKLNRNGMALSDIAIIVRSNKEVREYCEFLNEYDIKVTSKLESNILENDYIIGVISLLKILVDPYENNSLCIDILRSGLTDIEALDVLKINNYLHRENYVRRGNKLKIFDILQNDEILQKLEIENIKAIHDFLTSYTESQKMFSRHNVLIGFSYFLEIFGIFKYIETQGDFDDIKDVYTLFQTIKSWTPYKQNMSLEGILDKILLYEKYGYVINRQVISGEGTGVQVMTAHSSKGLEFDYVFTPGLYSGNWDEKSTRTLIKLPSTLAGDGLQFSDSEDTSDVERKKFEKALQLEEDRRLFFVAITRAKKSLRLSFPASIGGRPKIISSFLSELGDIPVVESEQNISDVLGDLKREMLQESKLISYSFKELDYIKDFFIHYKLSASDLNTFLVNPRDFLYRTIYRYPFEENENSIFGTMFHRTLELFYKQILETGKVQDYEYLEYVFMRQLEREYLSHEEKNRLEKRGLEGLRGYYDTYKDALGIPLKTEYKFSRRNIFFEEIPITGIIDKIELLSEDFSQNTSGGSLFSQAVKITDYKTGSAKYLGEIKGIDREGNILEGYEKGKYGRQLMFYKLLFENDFKLSSQYSLERLELDFCEGKKGNYKKLEVEFSEQEFEAFKSLVRETYSQMTSVDFWKEYLGISGK